MAGDITPSITGVVFRDTDGNGRFTTGEQLVDVLVQVYRDNGDGQFQTATDSLTDQKRTGADGRYEFSPLVGSAGAGFSGDFGLATQAQLDTPDGVGFAPDGDLVVADSHNDRVRRIDKQTQTIMTIAGNGQNGYDGDEKPALEARLNNPSGVAAASNGDIYIADTLNYRVRMIDHATGFIHTIAGDGRAGENEDDVGDGGPAVNAHLNMPSDVVLAPNGDIYIADMHHQRVRRIDARTRIITTVAGNGRWGNTGDGGLATRATLAGPAGIAVVPDPQGKLTLFIADYYNGKVRAVGPDGVIRDVSDEDRQVFGAPTRVAFGVNRSGSWLYVTDSSKDRLVALSIAKIAPSLLPPPPPRRPAPRQPATVAPPPPAADDSAPSTGAPVAPTPDTSAAPAAAAPAPAPASASTPTTATGAVKAAE